VIATKHTTSVAHVSQPPQKIYILLRDIRR
jgi:hypothetical protein